MKVRTCVIFACMTIVPALAMFSHHLPAGVRESLRTRLWEPVEDWVASLTNREPAKARTTASAPTVEAPSATPTAPAPEALPTATPPAALAVSSPSAEALLALGATAIDCRPFDGLAGTHIASCRVAVDSAGQLHRVFQAAGASPDEAFASLLGTVRAWQERMASRPATPRL
jgi:hypothetical protein